MRVLLVDDDRDICELIEIALSDYNIEIAMAKDATEAINIAQKDQVDLIITDIVMPKKTGQSMYIDLKNSLEVMPKFIYVSGYTDMHKNLSSKPGVLGVLNKPIDVSGLLKIITSEFPELSN